MSDVREMPHVWTVGELTRAIRESLEGRFPLVDLEAEVSGYKLYPSGHAYFTLKDSDAQIAAVFFKGFRAACPFADSLKDGVKLKVRGKISAGLNSKYQILVQRARPVGEGELMARYLALKAKLEAEGLFDPARKLPLPFMPRRIGIVTSPAGAVIHDMCRVLMRRCPALEIRLFPAAVQGDGSAESVINGLRYFDDPANPWRADLVIFGRGGGSYEDLFSFNDEALVRTVAAMKIPTISAVGHETDFTLADFAASRRAGTPSIAAEIAVPILADLRGRLETARGGLVNALRAKYEWTAQRIDALSAALAPALKMKAQDFAGRLDALRTELAHSLRMSTERLSGRVDTLASALKSSIDLRLVRADARLAEAKRALELLSPYGVLERGYSLTTDESGAVVRAASDVKSGERITTRLADGSVASVVV